ncbi:MAG TPA: DUF4139 domain-containing protein [Caldimonas sp.]|nr:DUF4139 domain-containing protein [Caldimonas sp.]
MSIRANHSIVVVAMLTAAAALPQAAAAAERRSTLDDQQSVAVTIYNEDLALVKDVRQVVLDAGVGRLALRDVSARMRPETAQLRNVLRPGAFDLLEQNFDFDLLTPAKLLEKYVGQTVRIVKTHPQTGVETVESAQVLAATQGVVLKIGDRIETGAPGRIVFDGVPATLRDRPTLVAEVNNRQPGPQTVELTYLSGGLSWQADYVAELSGDDASLDLNGWVTLTNRSGTAYRNAKLQLVAGDVHRVRQEMRAMDAMIAKSSVAAAPAPQMQQESLFEYHLYTLGRPTTLADNQTKQVALLNAAQVPVRKELVLNGSDYYYRSSVGDIGQKLKTGVYVEFANRESSRLGLPLPKGVVRVYKRDSAGNAQFVGEDRIDHTPKNEKIRLRLGDAFDVTADKKQTDFKRREPTNRASYVFESAYEIVLRNAKNEAVNVTVREPVPGDWTMIEESKPHAKVAAGTAEWRVDVAAGSTTTLRYRVLVRY